jgi:aerobic carbon-monoxide dehydrogenase large subunit
MKPMKFGVGQPLKRVEDAKFITGKGRYTADTFPPNCLAAGFLRSAHAHARFTIGDLAEVRSLPGVKLVLTADDLAHLGAMPCLAPMGNSDGTDMEVPRYPLLAETMVRHVGDAIVMIVAETAEQVRDAIEATPIDFEILSAVVDMRAALAEGAEAVWPGDGGNLAYDNAIGDKAAADAVFAKAAHVVSLTVDNTRLVANYMEPRAAFAEIDDQGRFVLTTSSQGVHGLRDSMAASILKVPPEKIRLITPDVGGGFGTKAMMYREYPLLLKAAKRVAQPVGWVSDRTEHFLGDAQGRDNHTTAEMALDAEGRFLALRVDILGSLGAYLSQFGPFIPWLGATMATGAYDIPVLYARCRGVYTHTVPVDAYRGAGRPEAAYVLERLVDNCARQVGVKADAIRVLNFIPAAKMPYKTQTDRTYDVGDFEGAMKRALEKAEAAGFEARAAEAKKRGKIRGLGFASYIECTAWGEGEDGIVRLEPDGTFTILVGTQSNGQGHATAYAQTASQYFDVPLDRFNVVQGDTDLVKTGNGTGGSRSIPVGSVMVSGASGKLVDQLKALASEKLEAAIADLEVADGVIRISGTDRSINYADLAALPNATLEVRTGRDEYVPASATYPNGTHVCELEIDPETGVTKIERYAICDDFGMTLNPMLLAGQVHGGVAQGIGQALLENTVYSDDGQLLTATLMDYCLPRASDIPTIQFETRNIPSTTNPLGLKGAGEAGTIGSCPAVMNAVVDALYRARGVTHIDMPATPSRIAAVLNA